MKISILTDNRVKKRGFVAEHGLSIFIEQDGTNILFDTGQTNIYCRNADLMGVDLKKTDFIVLSHGHYDHCGGLAYFPMLDKYPNVYIGKYAFKKRYVIHAGKSSYREIGIPWDLNEYETISNSLIYNQNKIQLSPKITLCSEIGETVDFEGVSKMFCSGDINNMVQDSVSDEQMLVIESDKGLIIFLGCSHIGIINCLKHALKLFPGRNIYALIAGMHLDSADLSRINTTIKYMIDLNIQKIIPLHCTGITAICEMKRILVDKCIPLCTGDILEI